MIHAGVERLLVPLRTFDFDASQFVVPFGAGLTADAFEIPIGNFGIEILKGIGGADGGNGYFDRDDFIGTRLVTSQELNVCTCGFVSAAEAVRAEAVVLRFAAVAHDLVLVEWTGITRGKI